MDEYRSARADAYIIAFDAAIAEQDKTLPTYPDTIAAHKAAMDYLREQHYG
jgi:uncharacterized coiled-coil protein SlyX